MTPGSTRIQNLLGKTLTKPRLLLLAVFVIVVVGFWLGPWPGGDDWGIYHYSARHLLDHSAPLYGQVVTSPNPNEPITDGYYYNPPWLAVLFIPLSLLPFKLAWSIIATLSMGAALMLLLQWQPRPGYIKPVLVLLSPPMIYIVLHGQVDMLVISGLLLPAEFWPLVALTKPQVAIGLAGGTPRSRWLRAALILGGVLLLSFVLFGWWPPSLLDQPRPFVTEPHNIWFGLWPMQIPAGVALILLGISRRDERLLVAGSPLLSPYAPISSLIGPWLAAITFLNDWQAGLVFLSWWGAVLIRG